MEAVTNNYTYRIPEQQNLWEASRIILRRLRTLVNTPMIGINERGQSVEDFLNMTYCAKLWQTRWLMQTISVPAEAVFMYSMTGSNF